MKQNKIVRSICVFTNEPAASLEKLSGTTKRLEAKSYVIQTRRICSPSRSIGSLSKAISDTDILLSVGTLGIEEATGQLKEFYSSGNVSFNIDLTSEVIKGEHVEILLNIIRNKPEKTFNFCYVFNNQLSSPFFPSATYSKEGFSIGLQPTDLSEDCESLDEWLDKIENAWLEITQEFKDFPDFLGIDSSVAPLYREKSSLVNIIKRLGYSFSGSTTTVLYMRISRRLRESNPKPVGLCGLMFPCLEDFELAEEYEAGNFPIERNIYLSFHSGLGIDTYPIGIDERPERVLEILQLLQGLSAKYQKPLSARFVSDGKARIGQKTDFQNQYLKDVIIRKL